MIEAKLGDVINQKYYGGDDESEDAPVICQVGLVIIAIIKPSMGPLDPPPPPAASNNEKSRLEIVLCFSFFFFVCKK